MKSIDLTDRELALLYSLLCNVNNKANFCLSPSVKKELKELNLKLENVITKND